MKRTFLFAAAFLMLENGGFAQNNDPCAQCTEQDCANKDRAKTCADTCHDQEKMAACTKGMSPEALGEITQERMEAHAAEAQ